MKYFMVHIIPSGMFVVASWVRHKKKELRTAPFILVPDEKYKIATFQVGFMVPVDNVPGRLGLLVTVFLCLVNMMNV